MFLPCGEKSEGRRTGRPKRIIFFIAGRQVLTQNTQTQQHIIDIDIRKHTIHNANNQKDTDITKNK